MKGLEKIAGINNSNSDIIKINQVNNIDNALSYNSNSHNSSSNKNIFNHKEKEEEEIMSSKVLEKPKKKIKVMNKREEQNKIDELKKKFINGKYNEALVDTRQNDTYLIKLLPFLDKNTIPKVDISIMEDIINRLNKKISIICLGTGRANINDILSFYIQLVKSKTNLKLITQLSIKDTLKFLRAKSNNKLLQSDISNIDTILKGLKV